MTARAVAAVLLAAVLGTPAMASGYPRLGGAVTAAESSVVEAVQGRPVPGRLVRVLVDTNGRKMVAGVWLAFPVDLPDAVRTLRRAAWEVADAAFRAVEGLHEVDVVAFHDDGSGRVHRRDVTFTAAILRAEWERYRRGGGQLGVGAGRYWFHQALRYPPGESRREALARYARTVSPPAEVTGGPRAWWERWARAVDGLLGRLRGWIRRRPPPPKVYRASPAQPLVALTFDDGPVPVYTPLLLDTLRALGVRSTFFVIGFRAEQYPYWVRSMVQAGHEVANHGYTHARLVGRDRGEVRRELRRAQRVLHRLAGRPPRYFRPPGGRVDATVVREAAQAGLRTVLWSLAPGDHASPGVDVVARRLQAAQAGDVILLHQGVPDTVRALPQAAEALRARGLEFAPVGEVLDDEEPS